MIINSISRGGARIAETSIESAVFDEIYRQCWEDLQAPDEDTLDPEDDDPYHYGRSPLGEDE